VASRSRSMTSTLRLAGGVIVVRCRCRYSCRCVVWVQLEVFVEKRNIYGLGEEGSSH
jgi:hypothetical protein